ARHRPGSSTVPERSLVAGDRDFVRPPRSARSDRPRTAETRSAYQRRNDRSSWSAQPADGRTEGVVNGHSYYRFLPASGVTVEHPRVPTEGGTTNSPKTAFASPETPARLRGLRRSHGLWPRMPPPDRAAEARHLRHMCAVAISSWPARRAPAKRWSV